MPTTIEWSDDEMQLLINLRRERNKNAINFPYIKLYRNTSAFNAFNELAKYLIMQNSKK
jgi:hypothetical protein